MASKKDSMKKYLIAITEKKRLSSDSDYKEAKIAALKAINKDENELSYFDYSSDIDVDSRYKSIKKAANKLDVKIRNKNSDNRVTLVGKIFASNEANEMYEDYKEYERLSEEIKKIETELKSKTEKMNKLEEKLKPILDSINSVYKKE